MAKGLRQQLRSRTKLITIWLILGLLVIGYKVREYCTTLRRGYCEDIFDSAVTYGTVVVPTVVALAFVFFVVRAVRRHSEAKLPGFINEPWKYDRRIIKLSCRIERILEDSFSERMKRRMTDLWRTAIGSKNHSGRHIHQRFLVSSPAIRRGEQILVEHNIGSGKHSLRRRHWVDLQGEYAHVPGTQKSLWGRKQTFYGRIHHTYEPMGHIRMLPTKPVLFRVEEAASDTLEMQKRRSPAPAATAEE